MLVYQKNPVGLNTCFTQGKLSFAPSNTTAADQVHEYDPIERQKD